MGFLEFIKNNSIKYGVAWLIITQLLAWITFFLLYFGLLYVEFDVPSYLRVKGYGPQVIQIAESGGNFALAFALNRILMPFRLGISLLIMPFCATQINSHPWTLYFKSKFIKKEKESR